jgi:hypothetical protein
VGLSFPNDYSDDAYHGAGLGEFAPKNILQVCILGLHPNAEQNRMIGL